MSDLDFIPYVAWISKTTTTGFPDPVEYSVYLKPLEVWNRQAPDISVAKCEINIPAANIWPWQWSKIVTHGDRLVIASADFKTVLFDGFILEVKIQGGQNISAMVIAASMATRLDRDRHYQVYGRHMLSKSTVESQASDPTEEEASIAATHYTGLDTVFNAKNKPNRSAVPVGDTNVYCFTDDGAKDAEYWTATDAALYLLHHYDPTFYIWPPNNPNGEEQLSDYTVPVTDEQLPETDCESISLWSALGRISDRVRWSVFLAYRPREDSKVDSFLVIQDGSYTAQLRYDAPTSPSDPRINASSSNIHNWSITDTAASCVNAPIVLGGRELHEISIELLPAWDPADDMPVDTTIISPGKESESIDTPWVSKYCTNGTEFKNHRYIGRLWDANTDGKYSQYERVIGTDPEAESQPLPVADIAKLADYDPGAWPLIAYQPLRLLSSATDPQQAVVEYSVDGGETWHKITNGVQVGRRCCVYVSIKNLASICPDDGTPEVDSLGAMLVTNLSGIKLRLTCCIAAPLRTNQYAIRLSTAGDPFESSAIIDRGNMHQVRHRSSSSIFYGLPPADAASSDAATKSANADAISIQGHNERRRIEAAITIETIDTTPQIGQSVERILGINYPLATGRNGSRIVPRIIATHYLLTADTYKTELVLDGYREAGIR